MKKSEFTNLVRETILDMLPEIMEIMMENLNEAYAPQTTQPKSDFSLLTHAHKQAMGNAGYGDMPDAPKGPAPQNPKTTIEGEAFASGKGIMEWFGKTATAPKTSEFNHSERDISDYMTKKFGV